MGCSEFLCRAIQFGILEKPTIPFIHGEGVELSDIPQSPEDKAFAAADLAEGCHNGIYQEITPEHAKKAMAKGAVISSAFVVWQEVEDGAKGRFVVNLSKQSKHWPKGSVRMDSISEFALELQHGDHFLSMDLYKGYRHFRLAPAMRDWFIFRYEGRYYQCVALPFGWGRSPLWFTQLMVVFVRELRRVGYRVLSYLDDFLIAPSKWGITSTSEHCQVASRYIDGLLERLGLRRHPEKGSWIGTTDIEHLGVRIDSVAMRFFVAPRKLRKVQALARKLMQQVRHGKRWVRRDTVAHFCGVCVSLSLAMPWARFYTRALYWDMSSRQPRDPRGRIRLSHQSIRDLRRWKQLSTSELAGRPMTPPSATAALHTDAADVGYGGTLNVSDLRPGLPGQWNAQGIWSWRDRAESISYRELKAIRLILTGSLGSQLLHRGHRDLLLHVDNQAVVHITNALVSASRPMMRELRRLKSVLDRHGFHIRSEWIPSVANKFADGLSRRFFRGDLQIKRQLRRSVVAGMKAPRDAFPYRPVGEHPAFARRQAYAELASSWNPGEVRLLCPPVDLIAATLHKLRQTRAPALLLIPAWKRQGWYHTAMQMASRAETIPLPPQDVWAGHRRLNPDWQALLMEINLE